ncbi:unnamed protein product, partial [Cladocopium goreaui]
LAMTEPLERSDRRLFFAVLFAHGYARVLSKLASAPLERVKVCLQVGLPAGQPGLMATLQSLIRNQGYRGLWRGSATHAAASIFGGFARLSALRTTQMWMMPGGNRHYQGLEGYVRRCSFLYMSGAGAVTLVYPLDAAYTCLAADSTERFRGLRHFLSTTRREHGLLSLYRGLPLCLVTALPYICIATGLHDLLAPWLMKQMGNPPSVDQKSLQPGDLFWLVRHGAPAHLYPWNLVVGATSGFVAQTACRRKDMPESLRDCPGTRFAKRVTSTGGPTSFYRGLTLNSLKLFPELMVTRLDWRYVSPEVLSGVYFVINASGNFDQRVAANRSANFTPQG